MKKSNSKLVASKEAHSEVTDFLNKTHSLLSDRVRMSIMASLASSKTPVEFSVLLEQLNLTKGNLSSHIQKLEEARLILVKKEFVERKPKTTYECTLLGRKEILNYLSKIELLLKQAKEG
ncbi:MAG: transcriptional regulator [Pseudobdellovibrionaceae bacterium]